MATFKDTALITAAVRYNTEALPLKHIPCELRKKRERERETLFYMKLCRLIYISSNIIYSNLLTRIFHGIWGILVWAMVRYKRKRMTVSTQQKTDTNITHPSAGTWRYSVPPIKVHTRSPNTWYWRWNTDTHTTETALFFW